MKKIFTLCALFALSTAAADPQGDKALAELSQRVKDLGHYTSQITINTGSDKIEGQYRVSSRDYHIDMGSVEFWGDENHRYEVSHKIEEVVVSTPSEEGNLLLNNPSAAFDLTSLGFEATAQGDLIKLTPTSNSKGLDVDAVEIWMDSQSLLPSKIIYQADGESVEVELSNIKSVKTPFQKINASKYKKYDWVELK